MAIAEALVRRGCPRGAIHFVGSRRGVEATRVPNAGFSLTLLPGRGIQRKLTVQNIGAVTGLLAAFAAAFWVLLRRRPKIVLSRDQLLDLAFDGGKDVFDRAVDTQVSRLRRKIEADARTPKLIKTVWGGGYMFTPAVNRK